MTGRGTVVVLAVAGLAVAALLGLTGYFVARETIALPATSLPAGDDLAPITTGQVTRPRTRSGTTPPTTRRERTETDDDEGGRGRGRGRGRGGSSGSSADDDGSGGSGRGRGRGAGGDD